MSIYKKLLLILGGIFFCWLLIEFVLMIAPSFLAFLRDPKTLLGGQKGSLKIYCIGDSFSYGMGMTHDKSYPFLLQEKLKELYPDKIIEVFNLGKPSHGLSYVYYTIKELHENIKDSNSTILVLGGWNVSDYDYARFDKEQSLKFSDKLKLFLNNFRTFRFIKSYYLFKKLYYPYGSEDYVPPFWAKTSYDFEKYQKINLDYLEKIANYAKDNNINLVFLNYPQNPPPQNPYTELEVNHFMFSQQKIDKDDYIIKNRNEKEIAINSLIRFIAQKYEIPLIEINAAFEDQKKEFEDLFLKEDGYHPSEKGQQVVAETVVNYFKLNPL
ncbi:MAG: SGNH/GDSL hydrolase family protein [Patescibacteria group bacterium]